MQKLRMRDWDMGEKIAGAAGRRGRGQHADCGNHGRHVLFLA
jgi:hypothetical protein